MSEKNTQAEAPRAPGKVMLDVQGLTALAGRAQENNNPHGFFQVMLQWAEQANAEISRLRAALATQKPEALAQQERDREDAELLRRALYYLEADAAGRYGVQGLEEMVRAGDHPVVADLRKRLGGSARFPGAARSSEGGQP